MTKADLVNSIAEKAGLNKADAEKALKAFTDAVTDAMKAGEKVSLVGFWYFSAWATVLHVWGKILRLAPRSISLLPRFLSSKLVRL